MTIKQTMIRRGIKGAENYSGFDLLDMLRIGEEFERQHPDILARLRAGPEDEPYDPRSGGARARAINAMELTAKPK